ncbi:trypsin-like peptidase domain-containing protein [Candidatus Woesearchaeota archaeon]|nr:trypsin-like peptidase domain-containing protein [Candidatus Woesearchaeota archaeon]
MKTLILLLAVVLIPLVAILAYQADVQSGLQNDLEAMRQQVSASQFAIQQQQLLAAQQQHERLAQLSAFEDELASQELLVRSRLSQQDKDLHGVSRSAKKLQRQTLELSDQIVTVDRKASDFSDVVQGVLPSVVEITTSIPVEWNFDFSSLDSLESGLTSKGLMLMGDISPMSIVLPIGGSGAVINKHGVVLTNKHVADPRELICDDPLYSVFFTCVGAPTIEIVTGDGIRSSAEVIELNDDYDLALLETSLVGSFVSLGSSDALAVGDEVLALGNPQYLEFTATQGIVSALDRDLDDGFGRFWLQFDAAVNGGNSGGPLVNKNGELVGVVTQKFADAEGLNFAIPVDAVKDEFGLR